jgi:hydroxycarboxylate dehydrogenase B
MDGGGAEGHPTMPGADGPALLLDAATTMIAAGKTRVALEHGKPVPAGALVDAEGNPTTDLAGSCSRFPTS